MTENENNLFQSIQSNPTLFQLAKMDGKWLIALQLLNHTPKNRKFITPVSCYSSSEEMQFYRNKNRKLTNSKVMNHG